MAIKTLESMKTEQRDIWYESVNKNEELIRKCELVNTRWVIQPRIKLMFAY